MTIGIGVLCSTQPKPHSPRPDAIVMIADTMGSTDTDSTDDLHKMWIDDDLKLYIVGAGNLDLCGELVVTPVSYTHLVILSLTEVVHQQIARDRGDPGHERSPRSVKRAECAIHLDEHFLAQVRRIIRRSRKAVANVVNPPVKLLDNLLPCRGVARHTATDKGIDLSLIHI